MTKKPPFRNHQFTDFDRQIRKSIVHFILAAYLLCNKFSVVKINSESIEKQIFFFVTVPSESKKMVLEYKGIFIFILSAVAFVLAVNLIVDIKENTFFLVFLFVSINSPSY